MRSCLSGCLGGLAGGLVLPLVIVGIGVVMAGGAGFGPFAAAQGDAGPGAVAQVQAAFSSVGEQVGARGGNPLEVLAAIGAKAVEAFRSLATTLGGSFR